MWKSESSSDTRDDIVCIWTSNSATTKSYEKYKDETPLKLMYGITQDLEEDGGGVPNKIENRSTSSDTASSFLFVFLYQVVFIHHSLQSQQITHHNWPNRFPPIDSQSGFNMQGQSIQDSHKPSRPTEKVKNQGENQGDHTLRGSL